MKGKNLGSVEDIASADGGVRAFHYGLQAATVTGPGCPGPTCLTEERTERVGQGYTFSGGVIVATTVMDPRGHAATHRFTPTEFAREVTDALGQTTRFERDAGGRLLSTIDPLGRITRFAYDAQGNVTSITDPQGHTRAFTYEPTFNKVTSITDPLGSLTTFEYDGQGNLVAITDPEQNTNPDPAQRLKTRIAYNSFGQPTSTTDPLGNTTAFVYDAQGNLATIADPLGNTTTRTYDLVSRLRTQTDPRGKVTDFTYDPLNRLRQITDALGGLTTFTYDPNGNLLTVTDARGNTTTHTFDPMDRLSARTDPLNRAETYTYDPLGNLVSTTDRKGQTSTFTYDPLNRRTQATYADGSSTSFTYDAAGRLTLADDTADPHRPITKEYDPLNRLLAETTALGTVAYQYDALGRRIQLTISGQPPVAYAYNAATWLTQLVQEPLAPVTIAYDAAGRRTLLTLPNGVSTEYQYDAASRLTALIYRNTLGLLGDLTYEYDPAGNRIGVGGTFRRTLFPDPVPSAAYDAANQQLAFGAKTMTFDANGNLTTLTDPTGTATFTWDARNRLVSLSGAASAALFTYDALGRRAAKQVNGQLAQSLYDRWDIVREIRGDGGSAAYLRSLSPDEVFGILQQDGAHFSISDGLGSTIALTDPTSTPATQYAYEPFGRTQSTGPALLNPYQFTSRENDDTGLYYYRARYYNPVLHRFLSPDPAARATVPAYAYANNNPVTYSDPLGLHTIVVQGGSASSGFGGSSASSSPNPGVAQIATALEASGESVSRHNSGDLLGAMAAAIAAHQQGEPVNIVGHSVGADTGVDLARVLNTLSIPVSTLATIDSVGLNNTTIPPNVSVNLNFYQNNTPVLQGGPNSAVAPKRTQVVNIYRPEDTHFSIDDAGDVRSSIVNQILGRRK